MTKYKKILMLLIGALMVIPIAVFGYFYFKMNSMYEVDDIDDAVEEILNADDMKNEVMLDDSITNVLLIGTDGRTSSERGRSDAMMIATIDEKHKSLKLTSLARDTYVKIPGKGYEKLNHAYSYGGASLLIKTIENNFGVGISHYVNVDFSSFIDIIDALGGITLSIKKSEVSEINKYIPECFNASSKKKNESMKLITKTGTQVLNGYQTLSYSRIRKNDSAFERDGRQRKVLQSLLNEVSSMSFSEATKLSNAIFPYVKTNIKPMEMIEYLGKVLKIGDFNIKQLEFPISEYSKGATIGNKGWVLKFDTDKCLPILHNFIFEDAASSKYYSNINLYEDIEEEIVIEDDIEEPKVEVDNEKEESNQDNNIENDSESNDVDSDINSDNKEEETNKPPVIESKPTPPTDEDLEEPILPETPSIPDEPEQDGSGEDGDMVSPEIPEYDNDNIIEKIKKLFN